MEVGDEQTKEATKRLNDRKYLDCRMIGFRYMVSDLFGLGFASCRSAGFCGFKEACQH